jgi:hypothetical protein
MVDAVMGSAARVWRPLINNLLGGGSSVRGNTGLPEYFGIDGEGPGRDIVHSWNEAVREDLAICRGRACGRTAGSNSVAGE